MSSSVTLISGAKKNVGDFLIFQKSREMVEHHLSPDRIIVHRRDRDLATKLDSINETDAIIICGGPGYATDFVPRVYPFLTNPDKIRPPVIPFALGWRGIPLYLPSRFRFSAESLRVINSIHRRIPCSTTRDEITRDILHRHKVMNVLNTGCPSLFDFAKIERMERFRRTDELENIGVSMAQNSNLHPQNTTLMRALMKEYPRARRIAFFHRGLESDEYTSKLEARSLQKLVARARAMEYEIVDLAYDVDKMALYEEMDIHIGYRVHAHAYSTCKRVPSFLLWEDGRGQGMSLNLRIEGVPALKVPTTDRLPFPQFAQKYIRGIKTKVPLINRVNVNQDAVPRVMRLLSRELDKGFSMFHPVPDRIAHLYSTLETFFSNVRTEVME